MYQIKKKIEDVFLNILLKKDFQNVEITEIQKKARISSKKFYLLFRTKEEILFSFFQRIDDILEKKIKKNNFGNNLKDNLFEVCMTRLDILYPYKKNLQKLYTYLKKEPRIFLKLYESFFKSMENNLKLSGINLEPVKKNFKVLTFSFLYLSILNDWFKEKTSSNEKLMSKLDERLSLIQNLLK